MRVAISFSYVAYQTRHKMCKAIGIIPSRHYLQSLIAPESPQIASHLPARVTSQLGLPPGFQVHCSHSICSFQHIYLTPNPRLIRLPGPVVVLRPFLCEILIASQFCNNRFLHELLAFAVDVFEPFKN